jgi:hypothetical protein
MVELRAFRGTKRSSVYRAHVLSDEAAVKIAAAGERGGLEALSAIAEPRELDKADARRLADEATRVRAGAALLELDDDLTAIAEVAHWCARSRRHAWLRIG